MNIELREVACDKKDELFFDIIEKDTNTVVGMLFTVGRHVVYEIKPEYRRRGIATEALKLITKKIKHPVLEIIDNNIASKKVATKAGYILIRNEHPFGIYEHRDNVGRSI